ncbi:MAG: TetR/AcrR family transcriptional regulator [Motiliproteus sp.]|nr:TetR/AcrR family transcriptional regulator [Motiliproteus sp.]MCW9052206.1 TetR/AcrR family transcriptional regulator [Motiliproteus sp.]
MAGDENKKQQPESGQKRKYKVTANTGRIRRERRAAILAAAEHQFALNGYKGTSTSAIAKAAGLAKAQIHYYFPSKDDLYIELLSTIAAEWNDSLEGLTADEEPAQVLRRYILAKLRVSWQRPELSKIFAGEVMRGGPFLEQEHFGRQRLWLQDKVDVIRTWIAKGQMEPVDPTHFIFMIWAVTQHYADYQAQILALTDSQLLDEEDLARVANQVTQIIFRGCGIRG